jgi:hypothetical protein
MFAWCECNHGSCYLLLTTVLMLLSLILLVTLPYPYLSPFEVCLVLMTKFGKSGKTGPSDFHSGLFDLDSLRTRIGHELHLKI